MRLLDLFCGAGGAGMGYHRAGFEVVGVDINPQPHYPFEFYQADALKYAMDNWEEYDVFHASPPCQAYAKTKDLNPNKHPELIIPIRELFMGFRKPYIIENVPGAPLINPVILNGEMFDLRVHRVRLFECSFPVDFFLLPANRKPIKMGRPVKNGQVIQPVGHFANVEYAKKVMGIDWMTGKELAQAIPPAYTEFIGRKLLEFLRVY
jgi:DNA (cytosine-5)-methyltransferase 1